MLRLLRIERLAVIDSVEVEFGPGFNVLTGETGAGKSVLVEAVDLLLGGRASPELVRTGETTATIEASFETTGRTLVVRRELAAQGRSRAFIDGELVTAAVLKDLTAGLIELHGQREHHTLLDPASHLDVLDAFGSLERLAAPTARAYQVLADSEAQLHRFRRAAADRSTRLELVAFQLSELDRAALGSAGEDEELAAVRQVLASADRVERLCTEAYSSLYEDDDSILARLGAVRRRVEELAALDPQFRPYLEGQDSIKAQLEDLAISLRRYGEGIDASPQRLQETEERLALLERLKRKYGPTLADVIVRRDAFRKESGELGHYDERVAQLEAQTVTARDAYVAAADALSVERRKVAIDFARSIERLLAGLAMERTRVEVRFNTDELPSSSWTARGFDEAEFFISPNPGEELRPLARIVSGGELSRVMLAVKTLSAGRGVAARDGSEPSAALGALALIFDEIDAGIGGRVADVVGRRLRGLGSKFQVLCITHLPQIAAYADAHFHVEKTVNRGRTRTSIERLTQGGRVEELARMLGGASVSDRLRASAREMLAACQASEPNSPA
jgi:DNA repair protein RecN (Recombination protein N)